MEIACARDRSQSPMRPPQRDGKHFVPSYGPTTAAIVAIGEAPGRNENASRRPFVGAAGSILTRWLKRAGLSRAEIRLMNTFPYQPPDNKLASIPHAERLHWLDVMHDEIAALEGPIVLVPMGNYALHALTGLMGIESRRGSIYKYTDRRGREIKVIPTIHPANVLRKQSNERRCILDWKRIASDCAFAELRLPHRTHEIMPTLRDVELFLQEQKVRYSRSILDKHEVPRMAVDIETPVKWLRKLTGHSKKGKPKYKRTRGNRFIACIGFADSATHSLTIPTTRSYWGSKETAERVWELIRQLLALPNEKIFQNGWFDTWHLERLGLPVRKWKWDTMGLHHCLIPNEEHTLHFMASVDSREPYWKDEAKSKDKGVPVDLETYWTYNGKDACVTYELCDTYRDRLRDQGRLDLYLQHYPKLFRPCLNMSLEGIRADETLRRKRFAQLTADLIETEDKITAIAGESIFGAKGSLSTKKLRVFLFDTLGLPPIERFRQGEKKIVTDEVVVRTYQLKYGERRKDVRKAMTLILKHRRTDKLRSFYADRVCDEDGRVRCQFTIDPENGRLSSRKNPSGSGANLQNQSRDARDQFVPDEGHILLRVDMSQAESRWVYMLTGDPEMIELARSKPWDYDDHTALAARIYNIPEADITKDQRFFGKTTNHGTNYDEQGKKMAEGLLKLGIVRTEMECQAMIEVKMDWRPQIRDVFHRQTRQLILTERCLTNSWGHRIDFADLRLGPDVFRQGYAFRASSEVSFTINHYGLIPFDRYLRKEHGYTHEKWQSGEYTGPCLRNQVHDELVISTPPEHAWDIWKFLRASMEQPRPTPYGEFTIPVDVKLGDRWAGGHEWKKPPKRREFEEVAFDFVDAVYQRAS